MALLGTLVNTIAIIIGSLIGTFFNKIPDKIKVTVTHGMALSVIILGLQMALKSEHILIVIGSLALGGIIGEIIDLEGYLNRLGKWLEKKVGVKEGSDQSFAKAFVTATLVFVVGAMAIIGAIDSGLKGDHRVLYTKSMLDGFFSVIFSTTLGIGVLFSAFPVLIYEGSIALAATAITLFIPNDLLQSFIAEMTGTGGVLILAIGLNQLNITKIKTANLLPSILVCAILVTIIFYI
ncbi:MAG: DUF554 domain-containing protein [Tuberibacillus sp.]